MRSIRTASCRSTATTASTSRAARCCRTSSRARSDLDAVAAQESLQINSALRTIAQQYLLYDWYHEGRCGITAAAHVGNSNHEGGRAVDLAN